MPKPVQVTMSLASRICDAAPRNSELLLVLSETQDATTNVNQQKFHVARLDEQLVQIRRRVNQLDEKRESELKKHKSYRDSVIKKFAYQLRGQSDEFAARAQRGQQEYFDVLQQEQQAKEEEDKVEAEKLEALAVQASLEAVLARRSEAQDELDYMYDSIFHGPTPEFPEEDDFEKKAEEALNVYHCAALRAERDAKCMETLATARDRAAQALNEIVEALSGGQLASTATEKRRLDNADLELKRMKELIEEAQKISPNVVAPPPVSINTKLVDGEAYSNPWGRVAVHDRIRSWRAGAQVCLVELDRQLSTAKLAHTKTQQSAKDKSRALSIIKETLQSCRSEIFKIVESAAFIRNDGESPPPY